MRRKLRKCVAFSRNILCLFVIILIFSVYRIRKRHGDQIKSKLSENATKFIDFEEQRYVNNIQIHILKKLIAKYNREERIMNAEIYGPIRSYAPIFVIFVDRYKVNLKYLLASLQHVQDIDRALLIFSHSYFDDNVNILIKSIDFTRVMQIFYPYSVQAYPDVFPGYQPGDCTRSMNIDTATHMNCTGALSPDIHGRYRDPLLSQVKHFWWWTVNTVFEKLTKTRNHKGIFIFLDDDVYLMEDFIYMAKQMKRISKFVYQCDFVSLQTTTDTDFIYTKPNGAEIRTWDPSQHTSVLIFDAIVWNSIAAHYYLFCNLDDYSWARSLFYLSLNRKDGNRFKVISSTMPRAFKTSRKTGFYDNFLEYRVMETVFEVIEMQKRNQGNFFPSQLEVYLDIELDYDEFVVFDYVDNNGGWSDPRDKKLCVNMTRDKIKRILLDMNSEFNHYKTEESDNDDEYDLLADDTGQ